MHIDELLGRLESVQKSGDGWRARCPACGGKSRKLSASTSDDGRILLHCFGGCDAAAVVQSAGLTIGDLFPERLKPQTPEERQQAQRYARLSQVGAVLEMLEIEAGIIAIASGDLLQGKALSAIDHARLHTAWERISDARSILKPAAKFRPSVAA